MAKSPASEPTPAPNALAVYAGEPFAVLKKDITQYQESLIANIGDPSALDEFSMDRLGIPGGGGLAWSVPDLNGEPEAVSDLQGVIICHGDRRAYWSIGFDESGGGSPPDCRSDDAKVGFGFIKGDPPHDNLTPKIKRSCKTCPMAQWGSADVDLPPGKKPSNGQACTQRKVVFILRQGDVLPIIVDLAPTSIREFTSFMLRLTSKGIPCYGAVIGLKLRNENSNNGIKYSVVAPRLISVLSDADTEKMGQVSKMLKPWFDKTGAVSPQPEAE